MLPASAKKNGSSQKPRPWTCVSFSGSRVHVDDPGAGFWESQGYSGAHLPRRGTETPTEKRKGREKNPFGRCVTPRCGRRLNPASVCFSYFWQRAVEFLGLHPLPAQAGQRTVQIRPVPACGPGPGCAATEPLTFQPRSWVFLVISYCSHDLCFSRP